MDAMDANCWQGMLQIVHFQRKPFPGYVSIERLFADIRNAMPGHVECFTHVCPFFSKGIFPRIKNMLDAAKHQGEVNHICAGPRWQSFPDWVVEIL